MLDIPIQDTFEKSTSQLESKISSILRPVTCTNLHRPWMHAVIGVSLGLMVVKMGWMPCVYDQAVTLGTFTSPADILPLIAGGYQMEDSDDRRSKHELLWNCINVSLILRRQTHKEQYLSPWKMRLLSLTAILSVAGLVAAHGDHYPLTTEELIESNVSLCLISALLVCSMLILTVHRGLMPLAPLRLVPALQPSGPLKRLGSLAASFR